MAGRHLIAIVILLYGIDLVKGSVVVCGLNQTAEFHCNLNTSSLILPSILWTVTASPIITGEQTSFKEFQINCTEENENITVQCMARDIGNLSSGTIYGDLITLHIQGILDKVREVNITTNCSSITLTWQPPFSLDIPNIDPDMTFCVEVYNISEGERTPLHHLGRCCIVTPHYTIPTNNSGLMLHYQFIVTAVNVVGRGASSDPRSVEFYDGIIQLYGASWINSELELNISLLISVCFQELTLHFDYYDSTNCSCPVQITPELNQLILNGKSIHNCSRCLDASVNNYTIYMKTDGGTVSNSLIVMYSIDNIMTTQTHMTSMASPIIIIVTAALAGGTGLILLLSASSYYFHHRKGKKLVISANLYTEVNMVEVNNIIHSDSETHNTNLNQPTYWPNHPDTNPTAENHYTEHLSREHSDSNSLVIDSTYSLVKPDDPPSNKNLNDVQEIRVIYPSEEPVKSAAIHNPENSLAAKSLENKTIQDQKATQHGSHEILATSSAASSKENNVALRHTTAHIKNGVIYSQVEVAKSTVDVIKIHDVIYSDIIAKPAKTEIKTAEVKVHSTPLTSDNVYHDLHSIAGKWSEFALRIGIDEDLEDEIFTNNETNEACLQETLEYFFKKRAPFKELTDALCHIEEYELANILSKKYTATQAK